MLLYHMVQKPLELVHRKSLERLEMLTCEEALVCCKPSLIGAFGQCLEDQNGDRNAVGKDEA